MVGIDSGVYLLQGRTNLTPKAAEPGASGASIAFSPANISQGKGCEFNIDINVNTAGSKSDGTDAVILFDPSSLNVVSIKNGSIYSAYPNNVIDNTEGKVLIGRIAEINRPFSGNGIFATLVLKINPSSPASSSQIKFAFDPLNPNKTNDTNIVENQTVKELLTKVTDATISIRPDPNCNQTTASTSPLPTPVASPTTAAEISASLTSSKTRTLAGVSWKNVTNPSIYDQIVLTYIPVDGSSNNWVYAATCTRTVTASTKPKTSGTCPFVVPVKGEFQFKYNQTTASTITLSKPK